MNVCDMYCVVGRLDFGVWAVRWLRLQRGGEGGDPPFALDEDGFLPSGTPTQGELVRPESVAQRGALVLLGEPGSGKTTTFASLTGCSDGTLPPTFGESGTLWVTGSELTDAASVRDLLGGHLPALPEADGPAEPACQLVLVIDQLDESPFLRGLPRHLELALAGKDTRGLRVFVACRTAEYPAQLTSVLEQALGTCTVADLAPLRRQDAADLAASTGVCAEKFLNAVVENKAGVFASVPLTLKVLIAAYKHDPVMLSGGPLALFERGVAALLDEPDPDRASSTETTADQRFVIASRIATYLLLCGQRSLWTGPLSLARQNDVSLGAVCGGTETAGAGAFAVSAKGVEETLATALFSRSGPERVAFAHSSFAAFLAARYLADRLTVEGRAAERQLSGVFLVSAPDEDSTSIPEYLRETGAWLLAHVPAESRWLAAADPEALAAHSAYITCSDVRALLVDGLLSRAMNIELTDRSWQRARWQLSHPGLGDQLGGVLEHAVRNPSADLADLARSRLAVRLAQESGLEVLASQLFDLAESADWPGALRESAAKAAMDASPAEAFPRLRRLLASLARTTTTVAADTEHDRPEDDDEEGPDTRRELVGTLLYLLWPDHLPFAEAVSHIQPARNRFYAGMYSWQAKRFAWRVADADLPGLVTHAEHVLASAGIALDGPSAACDLDVDDEPSVTQVTNGQQGRLAQRSLCDFLDPIVGRVLLAADPYIHLSRIARILTWTLRSAGSSSMPAALDLIGEDGEEPTQTTALRRSLAEALLRCFVERTDRFDSYHTFIITTRWNRAFRGLDEEEAHPGFHRADRTCLLDHDDFPWALERTDHYRSIGDTTFADAMGCVAGSIANLNNRANFDLAYTRQGTPEWEHFRQTYEGVRLDSRLAKAMRANQPQAWGERDAFTSLQNSRLQAAIDGDATAFWQLVKDLWVNPDIGQYEYEWMSSWEFTAFPGAALWPEDQLRSQLRTAASQYLCAEHDHRASWLGTHTLDYRAYAGFIALMILHDAGTLDLLPHSSWASWVGTILENLHRYNRPDSSLHRDLLHRVAWCAHEEFSNALAQFVRTRLVNGETGWHLANLPSTILPQLVVLAAETYSALVDHTVEGIEEPAVEQEPVTAGHVVLRATAAARDEALTTWATLLRQPLRTGDPTAISDAQRALTNNGCIDPDLGLRLAVTAGAVLLAADADGHWPAVHSRIADSPDFADRLAHACAARYNRPAITETLPDHALVQAYRWLSAICPPGTEVYRTGVHWVTAKDNIHDWRDTILSALSQRGTVEAVREIRRLTHDYPGVLNIKAALIVARRAQADSTSPLSPHDVTALLTNTSRRVIRTAVQLAQLVTDTLDEIAADLHTHSNLLWDSERIPRNDEAPRGSRSQPKWRPKREGALAAYIAHELTLRLQHHPIVINREVVVKPTDAGDSGQRPDILVDAKQPIADHSDDAYLLSVPIEIKGSWHEEVLAAQQTQLATRYLPAAKTDAGVYLVGWYPLEHWDATNDRGKTAAKKHSHIDRLRDELTNQAHAIRNQTGLRTFPYVLEIPRALPESSQPRNVD